MTSVPRGTSAMELKEVAASYKGNKVDNNLKWGGVFLYSCHQLKWSRMVFDLK